jgi:mono/diheme cytochrome c family protein
MAGKHSTWHITVVKLWIVLALCLAGCEKGRVADGGADGAQLFQSICASCHGPTGKPTEANVARLGVKDLTAPELRARVTPELVENQVREGSKNKLMPAFEGALSDEQIKAVAAYVASPEFLDRK